METEKHFPVMRVIFATLLALAAVVALIVGTTVLDMQHPTRFDDPFFSTVSSEEERIQVLTALAATSSSATSEEKTESLGELQALAQEETTEEEDKHRLLEDLKQ